MSGGGCSSAWPQVWRLTREENGHGVEIKEVGSPTGWLMLRYRRDNGQIIFRVAWIQKRIKPAGPWCNFAYAGGVESQTISTGPRSNKINTSAGITRYE